MKPFFVSRAVLESWIECGRATVHGSALTLSKGGTAFSVSPAVRITRVVAGNDAGGCLDTVQTIRKLLAAGADHSHDRVMLDGTAYGCEESFVCTR